MTSRLRLATCVFSTLLLVGVKGSWATDDGGVGAPVVSGPQVKEQNGMSYVSGGVGSEEEDALKQMSGRFNLKVTLATDHGKFLGGGPVRIENKQGQTLLDANSEGPMFLVKLPPGEYKISVLANGKPLARTVQVSSDKQEQVAFVIPDAAADPYKAGDAPDPR